MNIDTMTETDMNLAIAKHVMQWKPDAYLHLWKSDEHNTRSTFRSVTPRMPCKFFLPFTDANATREMEAELQRRGLAGQYIAALVKVLDTNIEPDDKTVRHLVYVSDLWLLATATPADRCRAALRVVMK